MTKINRRNQAGWRRFTGWLAAYLLVLHIALAGASTAHFFAPANDAAYGASLCLNGGEEASTPVKAPAHRTHGKIHCALCAGGGNLAPVSASVLAAPPFVLASVLVPASDETTAPARLRSPHQSRAPPLPA